MKNTQNFNHAESEAMRPYSSPQCKVFTITLKAPVAVSGEEYDPESEESNERMYYKGGAW